MTTRVEPSIAHAPVMLAEAISALSPQDGERLVDGTLGAGGYTRAMLVAADCAVYAFDRDPTAIAAARSWAAPYHDRLTLIAGRFGDMETELQARGVEAIDGLVLDIGVSSMQIDDAERGFSFREDGPLSMRMDGAKPDAADLVNEASVDDLAEIFRVYGEERHALRFARAIVSAREVRSIDSTAALSSVIVGAHPSPGREKIHPATRVFQAIRIFVNDELGQLAYALLAAERLLRPKGRLAVVTFHSLEDRMVKQFLLDRSAKSGGGGSRHLPSPDEAGVQSVTPTFELHGRKPLTPSANEIDANPRARSAKLRRAVRTQGKPVDLDSPRSIAPPLSLSENLVAWSA